MDDYARKLQLTDVLRGQVIRDVLDDLGLNTGDAVLDAGCGIGSHLPLLAEKVGPSGHVTGLDISAELVRLAGNRVEDLGPASRVTVVRGDVNDLPFGSDSFDCVVSVDCAGYPFAARPVALLKELGRVIRPGGALAIMGWTHQQLLAGYPLLESRLNTASPLVVPPTGDGETLAHFLRAPGWLEQAGFTEIDAGSYVGDISAPVSDKEKDAVRALFDMLWENSATTLSEDEWRLYRHISSPDSDGYILEDTGYYGFFVYTCFTGRVPDSR